MIALLHASPDSPIARRLGSTSTSAPRSAHWFVWRSLIWSIWLFVTPLYEPRYFGEWFWLAMASYAVFLALYACAYYRHRRDLRWCVAGMAALAFALLPYNPGPQCYIIYACAFLAFCFPPLRAVAGMLLLLGAFALAWWGRGWSPLYLISAVLVGLAVGLMNISFERRALQAHTPDLLVADIEMPGLSGLELAQRLQRQQLPIRVVIVTTFARPGFLRRALDAGVGGYLLKDAPPGRLVDAIRQVHRGSRAIDPELALEAWSEADPLNDRERQVLRLAGEGASAGDIAVQLGLSHGTVRIICPKRSASSASATASRRRDWRGRRGAVALPLGVPHVAENANAGGRMPPAFG